MKNRGKSGLQKRSFRHFYFKCTKVALALTFTYREKWTEKIKKDAKI